MWTICEHCVPGCGCGKDWAAFCVTIGMARGRSARTAIDFQAMGGTRLIRRLLVAVLLCSLLIAPVAHADLDTVPDRATFSLGYDRLQMALLRDKEVAWQAQVMPTAVDGYVDGAMEAIAAMLSAMTLRGTMQTLGGGEGYLDAEVLSGGHSVAKMAQYTKDGLVGINLGGTWYAVPRGMEEEAASVLALDALGETVLGMEYDGMRAGDIPFYTALRDQAVALWCLASPYAKDVHNLGVPSGSTSHALTYEIDTYALRGMLQQWVQGFTGSGLSLGMAGTPFSLGVSEDAFDAFWQKASLFADTVTLAKPIKMSMTFGEGDILRTVRSSATLQEDTRRTAVSYSYTCSLGSKSISRKLSLDFQPRMWDTIKLSMNWKTSTNNKSSAVEEISISASGTYDGQPYRIRIKSNMANKYTLAGDTALSEALSGTFSAVLEYAGETVLDVSVERQGQTHSYAMLTGPVEIAESYDVSVKNETGTLFAGVVQLAYSVQNGPAELPEMELQTAMRLNKLDEEGIAALRATLDTEATGMRSILLRSLPVSAMNALLKGY